MRTRNLKLGVSAAACAMLFIGVPAMAKDKAPDRRASALQAVIDCRALTDAAARLACYDAAAAKMDEAESHGDIVVIDRAKAAEVHRQAFGLPVPSLDFVIKALAPGEADRLEGTVKARRPDPGGRWTLTLEDGAVWRQIDGDLAPPPHVGSKVSIRHGSLGSFLMNVDGQPAVKVHRDQ